MSAKLFLTSILLFLALSVNSVISSQESSTVFNHSIKHNIVRSNTYERVLIEGVWWIIEYSEDGSIINQYIDPIQD